MSRNADEIAQILTALHSGERPIVASLGKSLIPFHTRLLYVDPNRHYIIVAAPDDKVVSATLFSRSRLSLVSEFAGWHVEFPVADPQKGMLAGKPAVRLKFPEVIVSYQRRTDPRVNLPPMPPLRCVADTRGYTPFEGYIVDIAQGGIGFLLYSSEITLEPGTVLRGCQLDVRGRAPIVVDLQVRYSMPVRSEDGGHAHRSGCVFLNPTREVMELIESYLQEDIKEATPPTAPKVPETPSISAAPKPPEAQRPSATLRPPEGQNAPASPKPVEKK